MAEDALDAIALLKADHREVDELFQQLEDAGNTEIEQIIEKICSALTIHAQIEEEIAYPAFREAGVDPVIMDEAEIEHAAFKPIVKGLQDMNAGDDQFEAKIKVLSEQVRHHVNEEENEMFPQAKGSGADLHEIGRRMADRKREAIAIAQEMMEFARDEAVH